MVIILLFSLALSGCAIARDFFSKTSDLPAQSQPDNSQTRNVLPTVSNQTAEPSSVAIDGPLSVVIESPGENITVTRSPLVISGQADPGTVISFNDEILLVQEDRRFSVHIALVEGINLIEIIASDLDENQEAFYLTVDFEQQP